MAMEIVMMMEKTTRSNQMMTMSRILSGISVPMMQGMLAEKKRISEMLTTAMTNFKSMVPDPLMRMAGRNISGRLKAAALPARTAWDTPKSLKKGTKR